MSKTSAFIDEALFCAGIPGLSVERDDDIDSFLVTYSHHLIPSCPYCLRDTVRAGYTRQRTVVDWYNNRPILVKYREQRSKCPRCGKVITLESPYVRQGSKTTRRMDRLIGKSALYNSYDSVSKLTDGYVSKAQVGRIFGEWATQEIQNTIIDLVAPPHIGVHIVGTTTKYLLLSDLDSDCFLDIFPLSEAATHLITLLIRLVEQMNTKSICTEIDTSCLIPVRGVFDSYQEIETYASRSSVYNIYAEEVLSSVNAYAEDENKDLLLNLLSTPLFEVFTPSDQTKTKKIASQSTFDVRGWIDNLLSIRMIVENDWNENSYRAWKSTIPKWGQFKQVLDNLKFADPEIHRGFGHIEFQKKFEENSELANQIISLNQKTSFELLRARMLLTIQPEYVKGQFEKPQRNMHSGIRMLRLYETMTHMMPR